MEYPQFPSGFRFGSATAAFQVEGACNEDGKGLSIWDTYLRRRGKELAGEESKTACNTYHDFQTDIDIMAALAHNAYRFSVAWTRVMPQGKGAVNQKGLDYYNRLVDALLEMNIAPYITLFHWDMPQALEDECGGFAGRDCASYFADYVEVVVKSLGDRVKNWITLNEPWEHAFMGHILGEHAPGKSNPWTYFKVAHHELLGHGLAVECIRSLWPDAKVGITLSQFPVYPKSDTPKDREAALFTDAFVNRFYLDGVFKGKYPELVWKRMGLFKPRIEVGDMAVTSRPIDFLGVNYYSRMFSYHAWYIPFFQAWVDRQSPEGPAYIEDSELGAQAYPSGIYELAMRYRDEYGNPPMYITENGTYSKDIFEDGRVHDRYRQRYLQLYLAKLAQAAQGGADIRGYFVWTLVDNLEWASGFRYTMGIVHVDHNTQKRTIKDSAYWFRDMIHAQQG